MKEETHQTPKMSPEELASEPMMIDAFNQNRQRLERETNLYLHCGLNKDIYGDGLNKMPHYDYHEEHIKKHLETAEKLVQAPVIKAALEKHIARHRKVLAGLTEDQRRIQLSYKFIAEREGKK